MAKSVLLDQTSLALCNVDKSDHNWMVNTISSPECGRAKVELLRARTLPLAA
jgi:hypothetical protein